jgi:hypothetical protein
MVFGGLSELVECAAQALAVIGQDEVIAGGHTYLVGGWGQGGVFRLVEVA